MKDEQSRPLTSKPAKSVKSAPEKRQRTLFDMFPGQSRKACLESTSTPTCPSPSDSELSSTRSREAEGTLVVVEDERPVIPASEMTCDPIEPLLSTPKRKLANIPTFQDQSNLGRIFTDTSPGLNTLPIVLAADLSSKEGSKDAPIVIDSSPIKPVMDSMDEDLVPKVKKPIHPFFAPRSKALVPNTKTTQRTSAKGFHLPYPDRESQHVRGFQSSYPSISCPFICQMRIPPTGTLQQRRDDDHLPPLNFLYPHDYIEYPPDQTTLSSPDPKSHVSSIKHAHVVEHPAIARVVDATVSSSSSQSQAQLWTETWRPRCAKEVLGNEQSAIYLRNWLHTLALQLDPVPEQEESRKKRKKKSAKRHRIIRAVARKKARKDGMDDFIADDDEEDEYDYYNQSSDFGPEELFLESRNSASADETVSTTALSDIPETITTRLRNTILLAGPPGSGKTAAVFACAEELGWEVFEVYPGIGRRNGANVDSLVGEVGKNHLVTKKRNVSKHQSISVLLSNSTGPLEAEAEDDSMDGDSKGTEDGHDAGQESDGETSYRQSLILLEEVDVLFKDDVNFWPAVTNFIKDCRRPVICTCNDVSLVPTDDLPLQSTLYFKPCAPPVATSYLQGLACAEGYAVSPESIRELYTETYSLLGADAPNDTDPTTAHVELPEFDLRKAIHSLQLRCATGGRWESKNSGDWESNQDIFDESMEWQWKFPSDGEEQLPSSAEGAFPGDDRQTEREKSIRALDGISLLADLLSYLDSSALLPDTRRRETQTQTYDQMQASSDDENGYTVLYGCSGNYEIAMHDFHDRDIEMASTAIRLARGRVASGLARGRMSNDGDGVYLRWRLFRARLEYERMTRRALLGISEAGEVVRGESGGLFTEYVPYVREMVSQMSGSSGGEPVGRVTRNSQRSAGKHRVRVMECEEREMMSRSGFQGSWTCGWAATWGGRAGD